ncbi:MAG: substrate-binding domain-containing protein [Spirochaetales bacterium]|nr:substrate-binding domain-containing protein [Spirochaetales bacterium]
MAKKKIIEPRLTIGVLIDSLHTEYHANLTNSIDDEARARNVNLLFFVGGRLSSTNRYETQRNILYEIINKNNVDGLIIFSPALNFFVGHDKFIEFCKIYKSIPIVSIAYEMEGAVSIINDNANGVMKAVKHLVEVHNKKRIVFIKGLDTYPDAEERYESYVDSLTYYNIPMDPELVLNGEFSDQTSRREIKKLIQQKKTDFDAIVAANDYMAIGAMEELNFNGFKVPQDISVIGYDDMYSSRFLNPSLSTVNQSLEEQGKQAVIAVINQIKGIRQPEKIIIEPHLILRESCGCTYKFADDIAVNYSSLAKKPFKTAFSDNYNDLFKKIGDKIGNLFQVKDMNTNSILHKLLVEFEKDLLESDNNGFINILNELIGLVIINNEKISKCHTIISEFRKNVLPLISDRKLMIKAEDLFHQARLIVYEKSTNAQTPVFFHLFHVNRDFLDLNDELIINKQSLTQIITVVSKILEMFEIDICFLSLFVQDVDINKSKSRLLFGINKSGGNKKIKQRTIFQTNKLMPTNIKNGLGRHSLVIEYFNYSEKPIGFIIFEMKQNYGEIYPDLRRKIGSAIEEALLYKKVKSQTTKLTNNLNYIRQVMAGFIKTLEITVEKRDPYTAGHQRRVADLARAIATHMNFSSVFIETVRMAGIVHDLGKIYIPSEILNKPGKLHQMEFNLIKMHPQVAYDILKEIDFPWPIAKIVLQHHEKIDGSGYPMGLKGDDITIEARILTVADVVEAMASHRPYRPALGIQLALDEIAEKKGFLYDTDVVNACLELFNTIGFKFKI